MICYDEVLICNGRMKLHKSSPKVRRKSNFWGWLLLLYKIYASAIIYFAHLALAPHGSTSPLEVTGRPISPDSTLPPNLEVMAVFTM